MVGKKRIMYLVQRPFEFLIGAVGLPLLDTYEEAVQLDMELSKGRQEGENVITVEVDERMGAATLPLPSLREIIDVSREFDEIEIEDPLTDIAQAAWFRGAEWMLKRITNLDYGKLSIIQAQKELYENEEESLNG